jgi:hypothetical protein
MFHFPFWQSVRKNKELIIFIDRVIDTIYSIYIWVYIIIETLACGDNIYTYILIEPISYNGIHVSLIYLLLSPIVYSMGLAYPPLSPPIYGCLRGSLKKIFFFSKL